MKNADDFERQKTELLAMLSHELRNPLSPILASVAILRRLGPRGWTKLDVIERQTRHLAGLVDRLLDACTLVQGDVELELCEASLSDVVTDAINLAGREVEARHHQLEVSVAPGLRARVDRARLGRALAYLLENAAKYTEPGGRIAVAARVEGDEVVLAVTDTGRGMTPELIGAIFKPFVQGERTLARTEGGLGLGLTFVRHVVGLHGGRVEARSDGPGRGCTFTVTVPAGVPGDREPEAPSCEGQRLLVVDDNVDAAETLAELLRTCGHEVRVAHDGRAALEAFREDPPDAVLLDIGLPVMDGYQVARAMRASRPDVLLIAVTGYGTDVDRARSRAAGFDRHLVRPVDVDVVQELIVPEAKAS